MNMYYHRVNVVDALTQNYWVLAALAFVVIAVILGISQYRIRNYRLAKRFGDAPYLLLGAASALTITVALIIESNAGIIQLLDNCLRGNESPLLSVILMPFVAMTLGIAFGITVAIIGDMAASLRKRSLINKLRLAAEARRKANPQRIRRGQPLGNPRPGTPHPTRYNVGRDKANQNRNHTIRVNAGNGMRRR